MSRLLLALLWVLSATPLWAGDPHAAFYTAETDRLLWFVHASDPHVGTSGSVDSVNLQWLTGEAKSVIEPSFIVVTGDLSDSTNGNLLGYPNGPYQEEWDQYRNILSGNGMDPAFYYDIPGNHDAYNDQYFSYYLANSIQGRATGRTQVSWTRTGKWGTYHFLGINSADNTGAPFSLNWPYGDNAGLDASELAFVNGELAAHPEAVLTLMFGHHPLVATASATDTYLQYGKDELLNLLNGYGASLYGYGHTHSTAEALFTEGVGEGFYYLNVAALGKDAPNQFTVMAIDGNGLSVVTQSVGTWPVVLVTAPLDRGLGGGVNPYAYQVDGTAANPIRALVFDPTAVSGVQFRIGEGVWQAMQAVPGNPRLWQGSWDASLLAEGEYVVEVRAETASGTRSDTVTTYVKPLPVIDSDGDGVADSGDNCPELANPGQFDTDGDGQGDACDDDDDGDSIPDLSDNCPLSANLTQADADHDGIGDPCDPCPADPVNDADGDRICGSVDNCPATANPDQLDSDGDGAGDACDADDDNDSVPDGSDNCPLQANLSQSDADQDGIGDLCDLCPGDAGNDVDGDGVCGDVDNCPLLANPDQTDADRDGLGDPCDLCPRDAGNDADGDGVCANVDNCPAVANSGQADADGDKLGDLCDPDDDNDSIPDIADNCPLQANLSQGDADHDGAGDACDSDDDGDGVTDGEDNCPLTANPAQVDADDDGSGDECDPDTSLAAPRLTLNVSGTRVSLDWNNVPGATGYLLHYAPAPFSGPASVASVDLGATTAFSAELWEGASYYVAVTAYNRQLSSDRSNIGVFAITLPPPDRPVLSWTVNGTKLLVSWTKVDGAEGYTLHYAPSPYAGEEAIGSFAVGTATEFSMDLWEGAAYFLAVEACRAGKCSGYSNIEQVRID